MGFASSPAGKVNGCLSPSKSEWMEDGHHKLLNPTEIRNTNVYDRFVYPQYLCGVIPIYIHTDDVMMGCAEAELKLG